LQSVSQRLPLFWPERAWDDDAQKMSQDETDRLRSQIVESAGFDPEAWEPRPRSPPVELPVKKPGRGRPKRPRGPEPAVVRIGMGSVETDAEDTDFGEF
jgi:hypothetical protein